MTVFADAAGNTGVLTEIAYASEVYIGNEAPADVRSHVEMVQRYTMSGRSSGGAPEGKPTPRGVSAGRAARDEFRRNQRGGFGVGTGAELIAGIRANRLQRAKALRARAGMRDLRATQYAGAMSRLVDRFKE